MALSIIARLAGALGYNFSSPCLLARYCMMAQLSHNTPLGRPLSSIIGVRWAGFRAIYSGERVWPHTSVSEWLSPAARANTRTLILLTLGFSMLSVSAGFFADFATAFRVDFRDALPSGFAAVFVADLAEALDALAAGFVALPAGFAAGLAAGFFAFFVVVFAIVVLPRGCCRQYGFFGARSSDKVARERSTSACIASARCTSAIA
ncbi:hypothetical protein MES4922_490073 [Mesorhizobium ventifaucium]|uniref:Uncharacterized protein n=1 Tax=Mesorhizobium ventifaucium TaxID=666020 RepID=A0ABN8K7W5_9HYPH|nr:hypothetical protein MES4922_490073 [Mesorhizobium ventifaucium]